MSAILDSFTFPSKFQIPNLTKITAPLVKEKKSPFIDQAVENTRVWLRKWVPYFRRITGLNIMIHADQIWRFDTHHEAKKVQYLQTNYQKIDTWPGITYPDASLERLEALLFCVILSIVVCVRDGRLVVKHEHEI